MTPRQIPCFFVVFVLTGVFPVGRVAAQNWMPPTFALGDSCETGTDQLVEVLSSLWQFPGPCTLYVMLRERATQTSVRGYPLLGDWNGNGQDTPGVFTSSGLFHLSSELSGGADITFAFGQGGDIPVVGDWDGDGVDTVGVYRAGTWYLTNTHSAGGALPPVQFGGSSEYPLAGDWNNDANSTIGLYAAGLFTLSDDLFAISLTYVSIPDESGHPVTFRDSTGDGVALVVLEAQGIEDIPNPGGKIIIRPGGLGENNDDAPLF